MNPARRKPTERTMSGIIKAHGLESGTRPLHAVAFNFEDVSDKARDYLDSVRQQAEKILAQAREQAARISEQAKQDGYELARAETDRAAQERLDQAIQHALPLLEQTTAAIRHSQHSWLRHWERQTVHLASAIARRIIGRELQLAPEITLELVREALELALGGGRVRLHLHPHDCELLRNQLSAITAQLNRLAPAEIVSDESIQQGGCKAVTEFGSVDYQIDSLLARIEEELT
jgi:flagellar assembly protein FliH